MHETISSSLLIVRRSPGILRHSPDLSSAIDEVQEYCTRVLRDLRGAKGDTAKEDELLYRHFLDLREGVTESRLTRAIKVAGRVNEKVKLQCLKLGGFAYRWMLDQETRRLHDIWVARAGTEGDTEGRPIVIS